MKKFLIGAVVGIMLCVVGYFGLWYSGLNLPGFGGDKNTSTDTIVLQEKLAGCNELATATYSYTNADKYSYAGNDFYGFTIPFTDKSFILKYDGTIKAGINLDEAKISRKGTTIEVDLPDAYILSHEIDDTSIQTLDESTGAFNKINVDDVNEFRASQKDKMSQRAQDCGVLQMAQKNAETSVRALLESGLPDGYTVAFI